MRTEEEVMVPGPDKEAALPVAGVLLTPVGQHQCLTTAATMVMTLLQTLEVGVEEEVERPRRIVSVPVTDP